MNDNFGHQLGDELLCIVTQRLVSCLRKHDLLARFGGDEFVVLVGGFNDDSVVGKMGLRFLEEVSKPCQLGGQKFHVSVSIGVSLYPEDGNDVGALICKADQAMYQAKEAGRNRFKYFSRPRDQG